MQKTSKLSNAIRLPEPSLKFSPGHGDIANPKYGLMRYHPFDVNMRSRSFDDLKLGLVCEDRFERRITSFTELFHKEINPVWKQHKVPFTGFRDIFVCEIDTEDISVKYLEDFDLTGTPEENFENIAITYRKLIHDLRRKADVVLVQVPPQLDDYHKTKGRDLHNVIKRMGVEEQVFTQLLTANVIDNPKQDISDTIWNLSVAIYTKRGGIPWTLKEFLPVNSSFIGIVFNISKTGEKQIVLTGIAQLYNEFGKQVKCSVTKCEEEGSDFTIDRDIVDGSRSYHLSEEKAESLISMCLERYSEIYGTLPEHIVVHKTTYFKDEEKTGIKKAAGDAEVHYIQVLNFSRGQIYRTPKETKSGFPVHRGTYWEIEPNKRAILYTSGFLDWADTYPGAGSPTPIELRRTDEVDSLQSFANQILAFTKMDWNTCKMIVRMPVTLIYARRVGNVLREGLAPHELIDDVRYYM